MSVDGSGQILVTGAGGLIGSSVCQALYKRNIPFIALYRKRIPENLSWVSLLIDLEKDDLSEPLSRTNVSSIVHCAAVVPSERSSFADCFRINTTIDKRVAEYAAKNRVAHVVFISTTNLYGIKNGIVTEKTEPQITNLYAQAKFDSENLFLNSGNLQSACLRVNAPYGPLQKNDTVLKRFIGRALRDENLLYHGTGSREQDFIHADDVASAVLQCAQNRNVSGIYNIASGTSVSMKELARMVVSLCPGSKSEVLSSGEIDPQEDQRVLFKIDKARAELNWQPAITLRQGISQWIDDLRR